MVILTDIVADFTRHYLLDI